MRDDYFLRERLEYLWNNAFNDVERKNIVKIRFKGKWKNKFGHIKKLKNNDSEIVINGYFRDLKIPTYIIDLTIAHELVHYSHGFNSPLPRLYNHPHKGGIVNKDLKKRGFSEALKLEKKWIKEEWQKIANEEFKLKQKIIAKPIRGLFRWF
ncbi:hypothetical protein J4216_02635 [Candidatus Woesearchaeota archaeon]|nr:hypothetical protein [Candidatus Woesearchaeota archaeon]